MIDKEIKCQSDMFVAKWSVSVYSKALINQSIVTEKEIKRVVGFQGVYKKTVDAIFIEWFQGDYRIAFTNECKEIDSWFSLEKEEGKLDVVGRYTLIHEDFVFILNGISTRKSQAL